MAHELNGQWGTVLVRDHFVTDENGREYVGVTGRITVTPAEGALGAPTSSRESNWIAEVSGEHGTIVLPGCAVLGFRVHEHDVIGPAYLNLGQPVGFQIDARALAAVLAADAA